MKVLRLKEVSNLTGLARSTIYAKMAIQQFPQNLSLGGRATGWIESEIFAWINQRIEERDQQIEAKKK